VLTGIQIAHMSDDDLKNAFKGTFIFARSTPDDKLRLVRLLKEKGVNVMLAGNMGNGALNVLMFHGIEVYRGCSGDVRMVTEAFLKGNIEDSGQGCHQHGQHHENNCTH